MNLFNYVNGCDYQVCSESIFNLGRARLRPRYRLIRFRRGIKANNRNSEPSSSLMVRCPSIGKVEASFVHSFRQSLLLDEYLVLHSSRIASGGSERTLYTKGSACGGGFSLTLGLRCCGLHDVKVSKRISRSLGMFMQVMPPMS